jgi:hypothetical protein
MDSRKLFIGLHGTKEPMIGAKVYSFKGQKCYQTDFDGLVEFPVLEGDSFQIEQTGYRLLSFSFEEMVKLDSAFLLEIGDIELGTTGIEPAIEAGRYRAQCKCCKY